MEASDQTRALSPPLLARLLLGGAFFVATTIAVVAAVLAMNDANPRIGALLAGVAGLALVGWLVSGRRPLWVRTVSGAYWAALILTPVSVATVASFMYGAAGDTGAAVATILSFVIAFAAPSYFAVGGPMFWRETRRRRQFFLAGFFANAVAAPIAAVVLMLAGDVDLIAALGIALLVHTVGIVVGPLAGALFGWLFLRFHSADDNAPQVELFTFAKEAKQ